jgi:hypothetical protein
MGEVMAAAPRLARQAGEAIGGAASRVRTLGETLAERAAMAMPAGRRAAAEADAAAVASRESASRASKLAEYRGMAEELRNAEADVSQKLREAVVRSRAARSPGEQAVHASDIQELSSRLSRIRKAQKGLGSASDELAP